MKPQLAYMSVIALLLGTTVSFGAGVYASASADESDQYDYENNYNNHSVYAPGTGWYKWTYSVYSDAGVVITGSGTGSGKGGASTAVSGVCPFDSVSSDAERTSPGTTEDPESASATSSSTEYMVPTDRLFFSFHALAEADWDSGSTYDIFVSCAATGTGDIWEP